MTPSDSREILRSDWLDYSDQPIINVVICPIFWTIINLIILVRFILCHSSILPFIEALGFLWCKIFHHRNPNLFGRCLSYQIISLQSIFIAYRTFDIKIQIIMIMLVDALIKSIKRVNGNQGRGGWGSCFQPLTTRSRKCFSEIF